MRVEMSSSGLATMGHWLMSHIQAQPAAPRRVLSLAQMLAAAEQPSVSHWSAFLCWLCGCSESH